MTVAIIEFGKSHDECLLSQINALIEKDDRVLLICQKDIWNRNRFLEPLVDDFIPFVTFSSWFKNIKQLLFLRKMLLQKGVQKIVFNTAQGSLVRDFTIIAPSKIELTGILHTIKKLQNSFTQKIISKKIKKYLVLNKTLYQRANKSNKLKLDYFYPLEFPSTQKAVKKIDGEVWVIIPGELEQRRKDLFGSLPLMKQAIKQCPNIQFIFLGKSNPKKPDVQEFLSLFKKNKISDNLVCFDRFLPFDEFLSYIKKADFLWPMVHPNTDSAQEYFSNQISGTINLSFSYNIPLLIHEYYHSWEDFKEFALLYSFSDFSKKFILPSSQLKDIQERLSQESIFAIKTQRKRYYDFLIS